MNPTTPYYVIDAFTDRPFAGNPAAVVYLESWPADSWLQQVALEMNLAETAFLVRNNDGYDLRWFTPRVEVDLCGHATIASALALAERGQLLDGANVAFSTRSGILRADRRGGWIDLDFPALQAAPCAPPEVLLEALGLASAHVSRSKFDYVVEVDSAATVRDLAPDFKQLARVECRGVIVTALSADPTYDFISRFFAPAVGIDEDPVTGSAHCRLGPHWSERLGKTKLKGYQASARGGVVQVEVRGERVLLGGQGVLVAKGELLIPPTPRSA
jgi:PhzF family phenazine biosynthesis protein